MLPQALLFSSDQQVAEVVVALLPEFGFEVEHCADVFGAIERITSRRYDLLVVDLKEHLEASFLLKTAGELTMAKATPAVAVVEQSEVSAALKTGASAVLIRPVTFEQARNTIAALPQVCREQPSLPQIGVRSEAGPAAGESRIGLIPAGPQLPKTPIRRAPPTISKPLTLGGYANETRPSKSRLKLFAITASILGGIGLLVPAYNQVRGRNWHPIQGSHSGGEYGSQAENSAEARGIDAEAIAKAAMSNRFSARSERRLGRESLRGSAADLTTRSRSEAQAELADSLGPTAVRPVIPNSLTIPVLAMTSASGQQRLTPSHGTRWSVEPVLLPEEVSRAMLVRQIIPKYPEPALAAGIEGTVLLHALVGKDGSIRDLKLVQGPLVFGRSAFESVRAWRYRPYRLNGESVEMQTFITVNFSRSHNASLAQTRP